MFQYAAFYQGKRYDFKAASLYAAKLQALAYFQPPKSKIGLVAVALNEVYQPAHVSVMDV